MNYTAKTQEKLDRLRAVDNAAYLQLTTTQLFSLDEESMAAQLAIYETEHGDDLGPDDPDDDPNDPDGQNDDRAEWAQQALDTFMTAVRGDPEDAVCDLLCDLAHWCDRNEMNLSRELRRARMHYEAEAPEGTQFDDAPLNVETETGASGSGLMMFTEPGPGCPDSPDGEHKPDPKTISVQYDGDDAYFDVNCSVCGASGCAAKFNAEDVDW